MKLLISHFILILGIFFGVKLQAAEWEHGILLKVIKTTEVFEKASAKSKALAEIDEGATLLLRRASPRSLWLEVEDEDGNVGWIASSRTDYAVIRSRQIEENSMPEISKSKKIAKEENEERPLKESRNSTHELDAVYRRSWVDPSGRKALGFNYTLYFLEDRWNEGKTIARAGLSTGFYDYAEKKSFMIPLKIRYESQSSDSIFYFGPEMGILWMRVKGHDEHFNFSFAYTMGMLIARHLTIFVKPGLDLFYASRFSLEVGLGLRL